MIKQIKRTEPKPHSWAVKIFYKHQQAIRKKSFTSEIKPRIQLAAACIRPEVLNWNSAPLRSQPLSPSWQLQGQDRVSEPASPPLLLSMLYPRLILFSKAPLLCLPGNRPHLACPTHQSNSTPCGYWSPTRCRHKATAMRLQQQAKRIELLCSRKYGLGVPASQKSSLNISFHIWREKKKKVGALD